MNSENRRVVGDVFILQYMHAPVLHIVVGDLGNGCGVRHASNEQQRGQDHPCFHRDRQVGKHGKGKRNQPDADISARQTQQLRNLPPFPHVVGHHHEDPREHCHRNVTGQRRGKQQNAHQRQRVNHPCYRRLRTRADVGGGTRNGARSGQPTEQGRHDIRHALRH